LGFYYGSISVSLRFHCGSIAVPLGRVDETLNEIIDRVNGFNQTESDIRPILECSSAAAILPPILSFHTVNTRLTPILAVAVSDDDCIHHIIASPSRVDGFN